MRAVVNDSRFVGVLRFVTFDAIEDYDYDQATAQAIARAVMNFDPLGAFKLTIYVDGLSESKRREYANQLKAGVSSFVTVRGVPRDEASPLIRLADAAAGFIQDAQGEQSREVVELFARAQRVGVLVVV